MEDKKVQSKRGRLHEIIFEADTKAGKRFDVILLLAIALSVLVVLLESVPSFQEQFKEELFVIEWTFTILFTVEYLLRILTVKKPLNYMLSFYGLIDLFSILPAFLGLIFIDGSSLRALRVLRLMRVFRILKLISFLKQAKVLKDALRASKEKILIFLFAIFILVTLLGTVMYIVESPESGFTSIPRSIYWAIVTITTVGYGDIAPLTALGQTIASVVMIMGYAIIAVPTGVVSGEIVRSGMQKVNTNTKSCSTCSTEIHDDDAKFCRRCGVEL